MNRLTRKSQNSEMVWFIDHDNNGLNLEPCEMSYSDSGKAIRKLAAYEETGLTPQEIEQMKARMPLHQWAGESPDKMSIFSVSVSKIMELTKAEKQERILMLPCKVGDTLYDIYEAVNNQGFEDGVIKELKVSEIHINLDKRNRPWLIISNYMFAFEDFGKTVFLSKEEAEEALRNQ